MHTNEIFERFVTRPAAEVDATPLPKGKSERVELLYRDLKSDILSAKFQPGERLIEERLTERYNLTSRTPVREVLARLKSEGHVSVRGRSYISPEYAAESLLQLYDVRLSLEILAVQGAVSSRAGATTLRSRLQLMADAQARHDPIAVNAADGLFHLAIAEMTGNQVLIDMLSQIHERVFQIRNLFFATAEEQQDILPPHQLLLTAIERGVKEVAMAEMSYHLTESRQKFKDQLN
ncbi:GntR family transcriptional regulator [Microbulbifer sp. S227A]|uniref:GntR family transcriptional regulator n=1 Tax=Microbulbifer sp. S227A TaxID=3415131 RepID=UPI003C7BA229